MIVYERKRFAERHQRSRKSPPQNRSHRDRIAKCTQTYPRDTFRRKRHTKRGDKRKVFAEELFTHNNGIEVKRDATANLDKPLCGRNTISHRGDAVLLLRDDSFDIDGKTEHKIDR